MSKQIVRLTESQIREQVNYAQKYYDLIQKELSHKDLVNLENVATWTAAYKKHSELAFNGVVIIEMA